MTYVAESVDVPPGGVIYNMATGVRGAIKVRRFQSSDLTAVLDIERICFETDAWPADAFKRRSDLFLVAQLTAGIAGYSLTEVGRETAELASIAVLPEYRRAGVAATLLLETIARVKRRGALELRLMVRRDNEAAIALYRGFGFARTATLRNYYSDGASGWRMRLPLR